MFGEIYFSVKQTLHFLKFRVQQSLIFLYHHVINKNRLSSSSTWKQKASLPWCVKQSAARAVTISRTRRWPCWERRGETEINSICCLKDRWIPFGVYERTRFLGKLVTKWMSVKMKLEDIKLVRPHMQETTCGTKTWDKLSLGLQSKQNSVDTCCC